MAKKALSVVRARQKLLERIDVAAAARACAEWTNGYRAAKSASDAADAELYAKEMRQWHAYGEQQALLRSALNAYARALRAAAKAKK